MAIKDWPGGVISKTPVVPAGTNANSAASGVWTLDQVAYWQKQGIWPNPANVVDPYFYDVSLLLTGNGTNGAQNNTFLDSSTNNFTITRNGNTTQGTFSPYGNLWSTYTDPAATRAYLSFSFSGSPFETAVTGTNYTIEAWVNRAYDSGNQYQCICSSSGDRNNILTVNGSNTCQFKSNGGDLLFSPTASTFFPIGEWVHFALVCQGTTWTLYRNGISQGTASGSKTTNGGTMEVLGRGDMNNFGYISNFRVSNSARYTTNFTPSTTPFTADGNTVMLLSSTNRGPKDISANNQQFTQGGTITTTRFSPFNPTAPYSAATIGGSGYFDGAGDYLNTPATGLFAPTGDFTIGLWFYPTSLANAYSQPLGNYTGNNPTSWLIEIPSNGAVNIYTNGASVRISSAAGTIKVGQWYYLSIVRSGSVITAYVNGVSIGTYTQSGTFGSATQVIYIGQVQTNYACAGYIADIKLLDGSAVTTVPTAPMTATTGTKLLLNFTNAGIPDAAMMNDLETVGNAQVSTSVVKYGTGSLAFDGSGDWLVAPTTPNCSFETGDFTIEGWVYPSAVTGTDRCLWDTRAAAGDSGMVLFINSSGNLSTYTSAAIRITSSGTLTANTWQHIALVRSSGTMAFYINGTQSGTLSYSTAITCPGRVWVGVRYDAAAPYTGYIDDLRITKGYARYTSSFTPPTAAFPTF